MVHNQLLIKHEKICIKHKKIFISKLQTEAAVKNKGREGGGGREVLLDNMAMVESSVSWSSFIRIKMYITKSPSICVAWRVQLDP